MNLEGLDAILNKEEIVQTQRPADLLDRPEMVSRTYINHVRSYIPLGREAQGQNNGESVTDFERRVVRGIKDAEALRGYITAEYGYGKTSTMLYLWQQAQAANILAVPPFVMTQLPDLITATYGWLSYELQRTRPGSPFINDVATLYRDIIDRSAESLSRQYKIDRTSAQQLLKDRPELQKLNTADYLRFFEQTVAIAREAGFEGVLVLPDEVQQYIDPEVKTGAKDPISPLFELISGLITRRKHLHFGLVMVLPPKELDVLRDQRGDLVHRLETKLDLRTVYSRDFPLRLWDRLAKQFNFESHQYRIASEATLTALGQICARPDLSDGPRTVVNTFRLMTRRYLERGSPADDPYTPEHLINDFLNAKITFDSSKKIPQTTNKALGHSLVKGYPDRERAIKWAAAFPEEGVTRDIQQGQGLIQAFDTLLISAQGDLVISVGDVANKGITLRGLDRVELSVDTLSILIREFWRIFDEQNHTAHRRAMQGFFNLLTEKVFPNNQWQIEETRHDSLLTRNRGMLLRGAFASYQRKFPERRLQIRLLWEDEPVKDMEPDGEFVVQIRLKLYLDQMEAERRQRYTPIEIDYDSRQINLTLNMMHQDESSVSPNLEKTIGAIVSPYKFTPLLMLALHEFINEKRANSQIPKSDDQHIQYMFQPDLLDNVFRFLFNPDVGGPFNAAQERILEETTRLLLDAMYPDYHTLMQVNTWTSSLNKYRNALKHLETTHERQGQMVVLGTKDEISELFTLSNTGLDTFISNYVVLLNIRQPFPTQREIKEGKAGAVMFQLHPLERQIKKWLEQSPETKKHKVGQQSFTVHVIPTNQVYLQAAKLGYHHKEIDEIIDLMEDRGLIAREQRGVIREEVNQAPSIDELAIEVEGWQRDLGLLLEIYSQNNQLRTWYQDAQQVANALNGLRQKPDDEKAIIARRSVQTYRRHLEQFIKDQHKTLISSIQLFERQLPQLNPHHLKALGTPVQGSVNFVEQVNDVKSRILRQFNALKNETDQYRRQAETVAAGLRAENLSLEALIRLAGEFKELQGRHQPLLEKCQNSASDFERFNEWGRLVLAGSNILDQMNELGDAVSQERERFQKLSQDIRGHLSARKLDALPDAPTYESQLREIDEAVRVIKAEANARFTSLQDRYRQALISTLKFPPDKLWTPYSYNPSDPDDTYRRLRLEVQSALEKLYHQIETRVSEFKSTVDRLRTDPSIKSLTPEEQELITNKSNTMLESLTQLSNQLSVVEQRANDLTIVSDFPEDNQGEFQHLLQIIQPLPERLAMVGRELKEAETLIKTQAPEGDEKVVLEFLNNRGSSEFNDLRQKLSLSDDALWRAIRGLYIKRRIRLPIEAIQ